MAKASSIELSPHSETVTPPVQAQKRRRPKSASREADHPPATSPTEYGVSSDRVASHVTPILIGVGIGAGLVLTGAVMRSRQREHGISPYSGPHKELLGALTKTALFALASVVGGGSVRSVATKALTDVAKVWTAQG